jgi:uncharacterized protein (TIGR00645 family)
MFSNNQRKLNKSKFVYLIEKIIFATRWLLIPFYLILIGALAIYMIVDVKEFIHYAKHFSILSKEGATLTLIEMIDLAMIAALCKMIVTGGYNSFISKNRGLYRNKKARSVAMNQINTLKKLAHKKDMNSQADFLMRSCR